MKRVFAFILCLLLILSLLPAAVFMVQAAAMDTSGPLYAGYAKVRIDPSGHPDGAITGLPMSGYGSSADRLSSSFMDDTGDGKVDEKDGLFATCIAISDQYGKTIIYYGIDIVNSSTSWTNPAKQVIIAALKEAGYELESGDFYISASHTHSGPDLTYGVSFTEDKLAEDKVAQTAKKYRDWVFELLAQAAVDAMEDREEVTLTKGTVDASEAIKAMNPKATVNQQRLNYVRHYKTVNSGQTLYGGSNFGYTKYTAATTMAMEPVDLMHLVQLTPKTGDKDPIVLVNWDAHSTINSTTSTTYGNNNHYKVSSDWVNSMRYGLEDEGYRVAFSQGTAGNKTPTTTVDALKDPDVLVKNSEGKYEPRGYKYGAKVATVALYGLENCMGKPLDTSYIRSTTARFDFKTNAPTPEEAELVTAMLAADPSTYPSGYTDLIAYLSHADTWSNRSQYYAAFPYLKNINSRYQLSNIKSRMKYLTTEDSYITVGVLCIGKELSFVVSGNELADRYSSTDTLSNITDNDWDDLIDDTYGRPIVMGYTNDANGYIPHQLAYTYNEGSTSYAIGSYESQVARYARYTGEQLIPFYKDLLDSINSTEARYQCVCGGKAIDGENGHTCEIVEFLPWNRSDILPTGGNYYLTKDVVTSYQTDFSNSTLCLDLNGHNITHKVTAAQGAKAEAKENHNTRVLCPGAGAHLYLTDSTSNPGTISRDLSDLTDTQKSKITNYGLIVSVYGSGKFTMFDGILDATGTVTGGGGCLCVYNQNSEFSMYGGVMRGTKSSNGGVAFNRGSMYLYGGELTGGTTSGNTGSPGIYCTYESGAAVRGNVTVGGNVRVWDNKRADGVQANINVSSKLQENFTVTGNFNGEIGLTVSSPTQGKVVGISDNASIIPGSILIDNNTDYAVVPSGNTLVIQTAEDKATVLSDGQEQNYKTLSRAVSAYPGGEAVIKLLADSTEAVTFPAKANLDLNGFDLTGNVTQKGTLFVKDSATDDYTTADAQGCGILPKSLTNVKPMPGYLMETQTKGYSFHCLNLDTVAVNLRPSEVGLYFQSQFGGDEYVKSIVKSYGVELGAGETPNFAEGTYTVYDGTTWMVGADNNGNANNLGQGTLLKDIMTTVNSDDDNLTNATMAIYGRAYVELTDGRRFVGNMVCLTLQDVMVGNSEMLGADGLWKDLTETQQNALVEMYKTYEAVMSDWKLPNIETAYEEATA